MGKFYTKALTWLVIEEETGDAHAAFLIRSDAERWANQNERFGTVYIVREQRSKK